MRLRSDIWVSAYLRRVDLEGAAAVLIKRGAAEAGAIFIRLDCIDGRIALFGPAPQSEIATDDGIRRFCRMHEAEWIAAGEAHTLLARETRFDPDLWIVDVEDRQGRDFLDDALIG